VRAKVKLGVMMSLVGLLAGCEGKANGGPNDGGTGNPGGGGSEQAQPSKVIGRAVDTQGKPLPNVQIYVGGAGVQTTPRRGTTNAEGRYSVDGFIDQFTYKAYGWLPVKYQGKDFCLRLAHENASEYEPFVAKDGAVRNFKWKLSGRMEDSTAELDNDGAYFGAGIRLMFEYADSDYTGTVELQLTPTGPLVDGSQGQVLTRTVDLSKAHLAVDIPLGPYKVTATRIKTGGARSPLRIGPSWSEVASDTTLVFEPETFVNCGSAVISGGVARGLLYLTDP
jgi:hypothetical protein